MKRLVWLVVLCLPLSMAAGCSDDTTQPHDDEYLFELAVSPDHVSTLKEIAFTLTATSPGGGHAEIAELALQRRIVESETWRDIAMTHMGEGEYQGTYMFSSSGEYEFRVMGMAHAGHAMEEMHHFAETVHVERAHMDAGGYRISYESFPGHIHEGEEATFSFWVEHGGTGDPKTGLSPEGQCTESGGAVHTFAMAEGTPGTYSGGHQPLAAGTTRIALLFLGSDGAPAEAEFTIEVAHGH